MLKIVGIRILPRCYDTLDYDMDVCKCGKGEEEEGLKYKLYGVLPDDRKCKISLYQVHCGTNDGCCGNRGILKFQLIPNFPSFYPAKTELLVALPENEDDNWTGSTPEEQSEEWIEFFEDFGRTVGEHGCYRARENFKCNVFSVDYVFHAEGFPYDNFSNHISGGCGDVDVDADLFEDELTEQKNETRQ